MKIGIFDPYLDDLGGGEKYMMTIAEYLSQKHSVDVFWGNEKDLKMLEERFPLKLDKVKLVGNIFTAETPFTKRLNRSRKYDLIIILSDGSLPFLLSKKTLVHFQQPFPNLKPTVSNFLKKLKINTFFCNSKYTKSFVDKEFGINSFVLYPPVNDKSKRVDKENIILNVGRLRVRDVTTNTDGRNRAVGDYKKQGILLDTFIQMVNKGLREWRLVLAVSVNLKEQDLLLSLKKRAEGYPVEFLVNKTNDELWDIYSRAKIYWHASGFGEDLQKHPEYAEHFGISTVEAMYAGAVPVVINAGGQREIVEDGVNGFLWNSTDELKAETLKLIKNEKLLESLSGKTLISAKKFTIDNFHKGVDNLILA